MKEIRNKGFEHKREGNDNDEYKTMENNSNIILTLYDVHSWIWAIGESRGKKGNKSILFIFRTECENGRSSGGRSLF